MRFVYIAAVSGAALLFPGLCRADAPDPAQYCAIYTHTFNALDSRIEEAKRTTNPVKQEAIQSSAAAVQRAAHRDLVKLIEDSHLRINNLRGRVFKIEINQDYGEHDHRPVRWIRVVMRPDGCPEDSRQGEQWPLVPLLSHDGMELYDAGQQDELKKSEQVFSTLEVGDHIAADVVFFRRKNRCTDDYGWECWFTPAFVNVRKIE